MLPQSKPDQRAPFYEDIELLIQPGFLSHQVRVCSSAVSIRSLMPSDLFLLRHRVGYKAKDRDWKIWCIASCVWMINGEYLLGDVHVPVTIFQMLCKFPERSLDTLFHIIVGLQNRVQRAMDGIEAFCYEDYSRTLWIHCERKSPVNVSVCGMPHIELLGSNHIQRMWMTYNQYEDIRHDEIAEWNRAKFITSAQAPKEIDKLDRQDKQRWHTEDERRQRVLDTFFYKRLGILKDDEQKSSDENAGLQVQGPKTVEELTEEMRKWVAGERDAHDLVVEDYKQRILQRQIEEQQQRHEYLMLLQREAQMRGDEPGTYELVGYTAEQLQLLKQKTPVKPGVKTLYDNDSGRRQYLIDKYIKGEVSSGVLSADKHSLEVGMPQTTDLNKQIEGRQVRLGPER